MRESVLYVRCVADLELDLVVCPRPLLVVLDQHRVDGRFDLGEDF